MAKKTWWVVPVGVVLCGAVGAAETQENPPAVVAPQQTAQIAKKAEAAEKLNGREWQIGLTPMSGEKPARPLKDTLRFGQGTITSERLSTDGFATSNYTLTVVDDDVPVWETMQTSETKGVAFWRGELHGDTMRGILSQHPLEGTAQDYSFVGHRISEAQTTPEPSPTVEVQPSAQPATAQPEPNASPPKKAKKGWWW